MSGVSTKNPARNKSANPEISKAVQSNSAPINPPTIVKDFNKTDMVKSFFKNTDNCFETAKEADINGAKNADYIPQLSLGDKNIFNVGSAIISNGKVAKKTYSADLGNDNESNPKYEATIQSCSKMFTHLFAAEHSPDLAKQVAGDCGTSLAFNAIMNYKEALLDPLISLSRKETSTFPTGKKEQHPVNIMLKELRETTTNKEFAVKLLDKLKELPDTGKTDIVKFKEIINNVLEDYAKFLKASPNTNINAALNPSGNYGAILSVYTMFEPSKRIPTPEINMREPLTAEFREAIAQIKPHILKIESRKEKIRDALSKGDQKLINTLSTEITNLQGKINILRTEDLGKGHTRNQIIEETGNALAKPLNDFITKLAQKNPEDTTPLKLDVDTFLSEIATAQGNEKLIEHMQKTCILPDKINPDKLLSTYTAHCSLLGDVDRLTDSLSSVANGGKNPSTGLQVVSLDAVKECLKNIRPSGAYTEVEEFMKNTGDHKGAIKTGVGGIILSCALSEPEKKHNGHAIVTLSTPLNAQSNSARGMLFLREFHKPDSNLIISKGAITALEEAKAPAESLKILAQ